MVVDGCAGLRRKTCWWTGCRVEEEDVVVDGGDGWRSKTW